MRRRTAPSSAIEPPPGTSVRSQGFTLLELLVSVVVTAILLLVVTKVVTDTQNMVSFTRGRAEDFREARAAFDSIVRRLSQATLNTYWDYQRDSSGNITAYTRNSDLHFVCGPAIGNNGLLTTLSGATGHAVFFQAPLGFLTPASASVTTTDSATLNDLLNGWGFYVAYGSDLPFRPSFLSTKTELVRNPERKRFRLMEFRQSADKLRIYELTQNPESASPTQPPSSLISQQTTQTALYQWFTNGYFSSSPNPETNATLANNSQPLADNVLAIILSPRAPGLTISGAATTDYAIAPNYLYDTRRAQWDNPPSGALPTISLHQLPPVIQVTLVAVDEASWQHFEQKSPGQDQVLLNWINQHFTSVGPSAGNLQPTDPTYAQQLDQDLAAMDQYLTSLGLTHRVFSASVALRCAKWSTDF